MKTIGIIPLRKNSKGIPGKNKKRVLGRPLYQWVLGEAIRSTLDEVYVFTNDEEIIDSVNCEYHWCEKVKVLSRSDENATDTSSTESTMLELVNLLNFEFDIVCLLQATSPLTSSVDIDAAINKVKVDGYDSTLSVVNTKRFIWNSKGESINYDFNNRPRRQDFDGFLMENGAVYACKKEILQENKNRLGGKIGIIEMPEDSSFELDEAHDFIIIENLLKKRLAVGSKDVTNIKLAVFDVDGVMTDAGVSYSKDGELAKSFNVVDGMGLQLLRENGVKVAVMTSENSPIVDERMKKLGIQYYYPGVKDKYSRLQQILDKENISRNEIAYVGDDINDLSNIVSCQWGICPSSAPIEVLYHADHILRSKSGERATREAAEFVINFNKRF